MIRITQNIALDEAEIEQTFIRASGPGGQNVNKVATAVQLRFDAARSPSLPEDVRARLIAAAGNRASHSGVITITAQKFRTQTRNRDDALGRLIALIRAASHKPKPRKTTAPSRAQRQKRINDKKHRGASKQKRRNVADTDW